ERCDDGTVESDTQWRRHVAPDRHDAGPALAAELVRAEIGDDGVNLNPVLLSQAPRLFQANRGAVDARHVVALTCQVNGVAPFALRQTQYAAASGQVTCGVSGQEIVRLGTVNEPGFGVAFVPHERSMAWR